MDLVLRFLIGGAFVTFFSLLGDVFHPKSFAGLFGAAPSIALATLALTVGKDGKGFAAAEGRSMIAGAAAFIVYATAAKWMFVRFRPPAMATAFCLLPLWLGVSFGIWSIWLR